MSHCVSPYIIRYHQSLLSNTTLCIVMDYCEIGSLRRVLDRLGPLPERLVLPIAKQMLKALAYLHRNGILHRDVKAANVMLTDDGVVKLGDFGVASHMINSCKRHSFVGSPYWMAPEVIKRCDYDFKVRRLDAGPCACRPMCGHLASRSTRC